MDGDVYNPQSAEKVAFGGYPVQVALLLAHKNVLLSLKEIRVNVENIF